MSEPTPMPTYWELAEEVTHLHGQLDKLQAENAKLRTQLADATESMGRVEERCAKLRELVRTLVYCMHDATDCDGCAMNGEHMHIPDDPLFACDGLHARMRELGIEVC